MATDQNTAPTGAPSPEYTRSIIERLARMRAAGEALQAQMQALHDELPEDDSVDGDTARETLSELRTTLEEAGKDATSLVNYLSPLPDRGDYYCVHHELQQLAAPATH